MSKCAIRENLAWFSQWMGNLKLGANVICLGFWSDSFSPSKVRDFENKLIRSGYQLGYIDFRPMGYGVIVNGEEDNSIKVPFDIFKRMVADGTYYRLLCPFIAKIATESLHRHLRTDIRIKKTVLSFAIKRRTEQNIIQSAAKELPKQIERLLPLDGQRYYILSKTGEWNRSEFIGMWRFDENFWKT